MSAVAGRQFSASHMLAESTSPMQPSTRWYVSGSYKFDKKATQYSNEFPFFNFQFYYNCDHFVNTLHKKAEINYNRFHGIDLDFPSITTNRLNNLMAVSLTTMHLVQS